MTEPAKELIRDYLDGRITPAGVERLNRLLESDAQIRVEFRIMATLEEGLRDLAFVGDVPLPGEQTRVANHESSRRLGRWQRIERLGVAALASVCLLLGVLLWRQIHRNDEWGDTIARIESLSEDAIVSESHLVQPAEGSLLGKGWLRLDHGDARIQFRSGATVELEGPAALGIDTPMRAYLDFGMANVYAPESARDFVVATESMEIVDLGTRFQVSVDAQSHESKVAVLEGLVDLHLGSRGADRIIRPLEAGCAAHVDASGRIIEITSGAAASTATDDRTARLLAHWTFDAIDDSGNVGDSSGQRLDGVLRAAAHAKVVQGVSGQALAMEDHDVSVDLSEHLSTLTRLDSFTFAAWVRDPRNPLAMLFSLSGESEKHRIQLYLSNRYVRFGWQDGMHYDSISGRVDGWSDSEWYHVAVTANQGIIRIYRNGEVLASGSLGSRIGIPINTPSMVKGASRAYLGRLHDGRQGVGSSHQSFIGQIDDVQIYSGALDNEAIRFLHAHPGKTKLVGATHE